MRLYVTHDGIGKKYGDWTQLGAEFLIPFETRWQHVAVCECKCGQISVVRLSHLKYKKSSGCKLCRGFKARRIIHGMANTREFKIWGGIKKRCLNKYCPAFKNYGGRGIVICDEWKTDFMAFYKHVGPSPSNQHEIDRIDNDGNYEPGNVRWVVRQQNSRNTRRNKTYRYKGKDYILTDLADIAGIDRRTIAARLKSGWSVSDAVEIPKDLYHHGGLRSERWVEANNNKHQRNFRYKEVDYSVCELSLLCGLSVGVIRYRLRNGWSVERAVETPLQWQHKRREANNYSISVD